MNRRKALKNLGLSLGTITLSPAVLSLLHSCKSDLDWNPVFFSSDHVNIVAELSDLIIPSGDNIPGSKELNLVTLASSKIRAKKKLRCALVVLSY